MASRTRTTGLVTKISAPLLPYTIVAQKGQPETRYNGTEVQLQLYSQSSVMTDIVTPDFRKRSAAGEIINNPYRKETVTVEVNQPFATTHIFAEKQNLRIDSSYSFIDSFSKRVTKDTARTKLVGEKDDLCDESFKKALAGMTANEGNLPLWIGEAKETVAMLADIGKGAYTLYRKTEKQRAAWAKGKLSIEEMQGLTLSILYGVLPLEQQIAAFYDGLTRLKPDGRHTSRGFATESVSKNYELLVKGTPYAYQCFNSVSEQLDVNVRAGCLFTVNASELPISSILFDPKQVVETAYALARLSFVIDWFLNVGNTLGAWAPSAGTEFLSGWVTVEQQLRITNNFRLQATVPYPAEVNHAQGSSTVIETVAVKSRYVRGRFDISLLPNIKIDLNLDKIFALILLFAKIKK